jgi:hypothetical protein
MPHRHILQNLLTTTPYGALGVLDYLLIALGVLLAALMLH